MSEPDDLDRLAAILRLAYSGELAAGLAYRGHRHSVRDPDDRARIRQIEADEWHHRDLVGGILRQLGREPSRARERRARVVGRALALFCHHCQKAAVLVIRMVGTVLVLGGAIGPFCLAIVSVPGGNPPGYPADRRVGSLVWLRGGVLLVATSKPLGRLLGRGLE